jgi:ubiquinone/menaquinone biosynthesis C-methylase UbiE
MTADEILALARAAGVMAGVDVLDLCCGIGGPALHLVKKTRCRIIGVDRSEQAAHLARATAEAEGSTSHASFLVADVCRLPLTGQFQSALLLETMLAIEDKARLLGEVRRLLRPGGRFGLTVEEGLPLSSVERRQMPDGDEIWLVTEAEFLPLVTAAGFRVRQVVDHTEAHATVAARLAKALLHDRDPVAVEVGAKQHDEMVAAHWQWAAWLARRRVRKLALVVERIAG